MPASNENQCRLPADEKIVIKAAWGRLEGDDYGDFQAMVLLAEESGKRPNDTFLVNWMQPASADGSVEFRNKSSEAPWYDNFVIDLAKIDGCIHRISIYFSLYQDVFVGLEGGRRRDFSTLDRCSFRLQSCASEAILHETEFTDLSPRTLVKFVELTRGDVGWVYLAKGDGLTGGVGALLDRTNKQGLPHLTKAVESVGKPR